MGKAKQGRQFPIPAKAGSTLAAKIMEQPGFTIRKLWIDGDQAALELDTYHVFKGGMVLKSPQVFIVEASDGLITRLQSYMPYRPGGVGGWMAKAVGLSWRVRGKAQ